MSIWLPADGGGTGDL